MRQQMEPQHPQGHGTGRGGAPGGMAARRAGALDAPRYPFSLVVEHVKGSVQDYMRRFRRPRQQKGAAITYVEQLFVRYEGLALVSVLAFVLVKFTCDTFMHERSTELTRRDELVAQYQLQCQGSLTRLKQLQSSLHFWSMVQERSHERMQRWHLQHQVDELREQVDNLQRTQQVQQQQQQEQQAATSAVTVVAPWWQRMLWWRRRQRQGGQHSATAAAAPQQQQHSHTTGHSDTLTPTRSTDAPVQATPRGDGAGSEVEAAATLGGDGAGSGVEAPAAGAAMSSAESLAAAAADSFAASMADMSALLLWAGGASPPSPEDQSGADGASAHVAPQQHQQRGQEHQHQPEEEEREDHVMDEEARERRREARLTQGLSERDTSARLALRLAFPALVAGAAAAPGASHAPSHSNGVASVSLAQQSRGAGAPVVQQPASGGRAVEGEGAPEEEVGGDGKGRSGAQEAHSQWHKVAATCEHQIALLMARHDMELRYLFESEAQLSHWRRYTGRELAFETGFVVPRVVEQAASAVARLGGSGSVRGGTQGGSVGGQDRHEGGEQGASGAGEPQRAAAQSGAGQDGSGMREGVQGCDGRVAQGERRHHQAGGEDGSSQWTVGVRVWWPLWAAGEAEERAAASQSTWDAVWHAVGLEE